MADENTLVIKVIGDDAQYTAVMKRVQRTIERTSGTAQNFNSSTRAMGAGSDHLARKLGLLDNAIRGSVSKAGVDLIRIFERNSAVMAAIPIAATVAGLALLGETVGEAVKKIKDMEEVSKKLSEGFRDMTLDIESSTEKLKIHTLQTEDAINKLLGKPPENGAKIALEEAKAEADEFAKSLIATQKQLKDLMSVNSVGMLGQIATAMFTGRGQARTKGVEGAIESYTSKMSDIAYQIKQATDAGDKTKVATLQKQMDDTLASFNQWSSTNLKSLQGKQARGGRYTYSGDITDIEGATLAINDRFGNLQAKQQDDAASRQQKQLEAQKEAAQKAKEALDKLTASIKQAAEAIKTNQTEVADAAREGLIMPHPLVGFFGQPSSNLQAEVARADLGKNSDTTRDIEGQSKFQFQWLANLNQYTAIQSENADAIAQASLQMEVATGRLSAHDAAVKLASIHTAEYTEQINALFSQLDNLKSLRDSGAISLNEFSAKSSGVEAQMAQLNGQRQIQFAEDEQGISGSTVAGATKNALSVMVQSWTDMSKQIPDLLVSSLNEVNRSLASALMAKEPTGRAYRRNIENALGSTARGIGTNLLNMSFQGIEGSALKKLFGIGGKPDGTTSNPIHTIVDKASGLVGAAGGSISGLLGSIGHGFGKAGGWFASLLSAIPHFAGGGDFLANRPMLVGEMGPEIVSFGSPGHITPNSAISSGDTNHLYIDARGSNDPAATAQVVHRVMRQYIPGIVTMSVGAVSERQKRMALSHRS